ncbi:hypothetical protein BJ875DRAFT_49295 [Amylocarpus encephaloides]|uniref:Uncharacterized protein n=1 Tax=Amylocarpus encephaloides TaxID=45428 RepID=A0A9P8C4P1_9HELO|nr:hypothetical protein BJ875DRAFT_49295 [Amylocarpus encephaloides]
MHWCSSAICTPILARVATSSLHDWPSSDPRVAPKPAETPSPCRSGTAGRAFREGWFISPPRSTRGTAKHVFVPTRLESFQISRRSSNDTSRGLAEGLVCVFLLALPLRSVRSLPVPSVRGSSSKLKFVEISSAGSGGARPQGLDRRRSSMGRASATFI